jgi:hypothetical protein
MSSTFQPTDYETVAAGVSTPGQVLGPNAATTKKRDYLKHLLVIPATLDPGAISIKDGADSAILVFAGGTGSVLSLDPFTIPIMANSDTGSWQVITGANVSVLAVGRFT